MRRAAAEVETKKTACGDVCGGRKIDAIRCRKVTNDCLLRALLFVFFDKQIKLNWLV